MASRTPSASILKRSPTFIPPSVVVVATLREIVRSDVKLPPPANPVPAEIVMALSAAIAVAFALPLSPA